jgi:hypothetical protein
VRDRRVVGNLGRSFRLTRWGQPPSPYSMKAGMLQRMGILDQPLVGHGGVRSQAPPLRIGSLCQTLRFPPQASKTWHEVCGSSQSPSAGSWYSFCVLCWAQERPFLVSLGEGCFPFSAAHSRPMGVLVISCVERKAKGYNYGFCQR